MCNLSTLIINPRCFFTRTIPVLCLFNITNPVYAENETFALRINAGGAEYTDSAGHLWQADKGFNTGRLSGSAAGVAISGTDDPELYQSARWDAGAVPELHYSFNVPNGAYTVRLHFADSFSGTQGEGLRIFDVALEDQLALENLDIFAEVGANAALVKTLTTQVNDGSLDIEFLHQVENPEIRGIEIYEAEQKPTIPGEVSITLEAEDYTRFNDVSTTDSFSQNTRTDASGGTYMQSIGNWGSAYLEYDITLPVDDVYEIAVRGTGTSGSKNSFRVSIDDGADSVMQLNKDDSWGWTTVEDANSGFGPYVLSKGKHTIRIKKRELDAKLDQLRISSTANTGSPVASFSQSRINFGNQAVGSVSNSQSVILSNTGTAPLNILSIGTTGDFNETNNCADVLLADERCELSLRFTPTVAGNISGRLTLETTGAGRLVTVELTGSGEVAPQSGNRVLEVDFERLAQGAYRESDLRSDFRVGEGGYRDTVHGPDWNSMDIVNDLVGTGRGKVLRVTRRKGRAGASLKSGGFRFRADVPPAEEYYFAYDFYVPSDWWQPLQHKMPALINGTLLEASHATGVRPSPETLVAFNARLQSFSNSAYGRGDGSFATVVYDKDSVQKPNWLNTIDPTRTANKPETKPGQYLIPRGQWIKIEQYIKLNTGGQRNGALKVWINGTLMYDRAHRWRDASSKRLIDGISMGSFYGGSTSDKRNMPPKEQYQYYDNFIVSDSPITH